MQAVAAAVEALDLDLSNLSTDDMDALTTVLVRTSRVAHTWVMASIGGIGLTAVQLANCTLCCKSQHLFPGLLVTFAVMSTCN
jgi:hypothetical protein